MAASYLTTPVLQFEGCNFLRQRLVLATLSGRTVRIRHIREDSDEPGLKEYEAGFIRLLDSITNGSTIEVSETGTSLLYRPGILEGGTLEHNCSLQRSIGYFLEPLLMLAPFAKRPICITLHGITNGTEDPSADYYRLCTIPLLKRIFPSSDGLELKINQRGLPPGGGGEVYFSCPIVKRMKPLLLNDSGKVKRIRGISYSIKVSPIMSSRLVDGAKGVLNNFLPDVYIYADHMKASRAPMSSGYGVILVSESTTGVTHSAEVSSATATEKEGAVLPEDLGKSAAQLLLDEIAMGGCADSLDQCVTFLFMAMTQKDVSRVQLGELTDVAIHFLRHMKTFFNLVYKVEGTTVEVGSLEQLQVSVSCLGVGFSNYAKAMV